MLLPLNVLLLWLCGSAVTKSITADDKPLLLTPLIDKGQVEEARNLSKVDPTLFAGVDSYAAYITVNKTAASHLFFWFFPAPGLPLETTPWLIWLQGGPGVSSLFGLFEEIGPIKFENGTAQRMPVTWGSNYSLLFIDNPVGTGFSFSEKNEYVSNEDEVGAGLLSLVQQFLEVFPELRAAPLFVAGESYAGKYIPALGHYIHHHNNHSHPINLRGLAIGDGWTDPVSLLQYSKFGLQIGVLDPEQAKDVQDMEDAARKYYKEGDMNQYGQYAAGAYGAFTNHSSMQNPFNFIIDTKTSQLENDFVVFLNKKEVRKAIHVGQKTYDVQNNIVIEHLDDDFYLSVKSWLEELLEHYGVMCYNGQLDVIVAYALSVNTYRSLKWSGVEKYKQAKREVIYEKDRINSYVKQYGNFMDVMVRGAGHFVPQDQPLAAKQMIDMFINKFKE